MNPIDDLFRNKLSNEGLKYDSSYWKEMESMLKTKKKKRPILFYFKTAVIFIIVLFCAEVVYHFTQNNLAANASAESTTVSEVNNPSNNTASNSNVTNETEKNKVKSATKVSKETDPKKTSIEKNNAAYNTSVKRTLEIKTSIESDPLKDALAINPVKSNATIESIIHIKNPLLALRNIPHPAISLTVSQKILIKDRFKSQHPWQFYLAAGYEYNQYSRTTSTSTLKSQEKTRNQSGMNLSISAIKNNWGIKTGLGIMQLLEVTNYLTVTTNYETKTSYKMINPNYKQTPGGTRIAIIKKQVDTTVTTTSSIQNPNSTVQFDYLKIPLLISYQWGIPSLKIYTEAGIINSILIQQKGDYTILENNQLRVHKGGIGSDYNPILFQAYASLGLKYAITRGINFYGGYGYSQAINSMVKSYSQKPNINSFTIGLEVKL